MALIKSTETKKAEMLKIVENEMDRRERRRKRIRHFMIAGLTILTVAAFFCGHVRGMHCAAKRRL